MVNLNGSQTAKFLFKRNQCQSTSNPEDFCHAMVQHPARNLLTLVKIKTSVPESRGLGEKARGNAEVFCSLQGPT